MDTCIVMGVGSLNGLGATLCRRFAKLGMHVYVAGRTQSKLDVVVSTIESEGGRATAYASDTTQEDQIISLFNKACETGPLSAAIYNAGNSTPGKILDMEADYFLNSWKTGCFGGFLFAREALKRMQEKEQGTILFTGASASLRGKPNYGAFNSAKAALRTLAQAMAKEAGPMGIHVAHVIIDGSIDGDKIRGKAPDYAEKLGEEGMINQEGIADAYEYLFHQSKSAWSFELDLRTAIEIW